MQKKIGIILGSGLNKFTGELSSPEMIFNDNSSFHKLEIISGKINETEIVLFSGRRHFYEGFTPDEVLFNMNKAYELGINYLIITNAAGGLNRNFRVSDLMLITSHLNFTNKSIPSGLSPVLYSKDTIERVKLISRKEKINLRYGSYCCNKGPNYETKSEIKFLKKLGIDAVGMSTVPEILYACKLGIKTLAISCITNILSEHSPVETNHEEVIEAGRNSYGNFSKLLKTIIANPV